MYIFVYQRYRKGYLSFLIVIVDTALNQDCDIHVSACTRRSLLELQVKVKSTANGTMHNAGGSVGFAHHTVASPEPRGSVSGAPRPHYGTRPGTAPQRPTNPSGAPHQFHTLSLLLDCRERKTHQSEARV